MKFDERRFDQAEFLIEAAARANGFMMLLREEGQLYVKLFVERGRLSEEFYRSVEDLQPELVELMKDVRRHSKQWA